VTVSPENIFDVYINLRLLSFRGTSKIMFPSTFPLGGQAFRFEVIGDLRDESLVLLDTVRVLYLEVEWVVINIPPGGVCQRNEHAQVLVATLGFAKLVAGGVVSLNFGHGKSPVVKLGRLPHCYCKAIGPTVAFGR
jgi:hypothetical protein